MAARGRRVGMIFIVLALVLVVILGAAAYFFRDLFFPPPVVVPPASTQAAPVVKTVDIVVLVQSIPFGGTITDAALAFAPFPADKYVEGLYFKTKDQVIGRRTRFQLQAGTILTTGLVSESLVGSSAASQIPAGMVAISIPTSQLTSVSYALQQGDHVSVLVALLLEELDPNFQSKLPNTTASITDAGKSAAPAANGSVVPSTSSLTLTITGSGSGSAQGRTELDPVLNKPIYVQGSEAQRPRIVTQMIVSDAIVLGVGRFNKDGTPGGQATAVPTPAPNVTPTVGPTPLPELEQITLVVTPQDAVTINYILLNKGAKINLVLRSPGDSATGKTEAVTLQFLMDQYNIPFPSKLPYGLEPSASCLDYYNPSKPCSDVPTPVPAPASATK